MLNDEMQILQDVKKKGIQLFSPSNVNISSRNQMWQSCSNQINFAQVLKSICGLNNRQ